MNEKAKMKVKRVYRRPNVYYTSYTAGHFVKLLWLAAIVEEIGKEFVITLNVLSDSPILFTHNGTQ